MAESKIKIGDVVKLKSGGPAMTVCQAANETLECSWFVDGSIQQASFIPETLKILLGKEKLGKATA